MELLSEAATPPNLRSLECPARGLPQGGKPATKSVLRRTVRRSRGRKSERISESELHGAVKCNPVALLTRGSLRARGWWDLPMGSSTVIENPAGLTSRIRLVRVWNRRNWDMSFVARPRGFPRDRGADPLDCTRRANRGNPLTQMNSRFFSARRECHSTSAATNLHGQEADPPTAFTPSSSFCRHLDPEVSKLACVASATDPHRETTRAWPH
jgi:hypothetical protein